MRSQIERFIELTKGLKVLVVGETIIDEFVEVVYQGQSMKSFCPVFRETDGVPQVQNGGAGAIVGHLTDFVKSVDLITNENREIVKTRFVDQAGNKKKHIELNKIDNSNFGEISIDASDYDTVIVADFGHGFCDHLNIKGAFHLMCQTNSYNFGFNRLSKWKNHHKKSVCLDLREASLQVNHRMKECSDDLATELFNYEMNCRDMYVTLGGEGALLTDGESIERQAAFKSDIVDTIGAGDTFFAFASLMSSIEFPQEDKLTIPGLAASLSTTWLCNEQAVTKEKLMNYADKKI
jgi:bifunctional ADP-heptose synthase (sugar kinase/adenylyltransferase)